MYIGQASPGTSWSQSGMGLGPPNVAQNHELRRRTRLTTNPAILNRASALCVELPEPALAPNRNVN